MDAQVRPRGTIGDGPEVPQPSAIPLPQPPAVEMLPQPPAVAALPQPPAVVALPQPPPAAVQQAPAMAVQQPPVAAAQQAPAVAAGLEPRLPVGTCPEPRRLGGPGAAPGATTAAAGPRNELSITYTNLGYHASTDIVANAASVLANHAANVSKGLGPVISKPGRPVPDFRMFC